MKTLFPFISPLILCLLFSTACTKDKMINPQIPVPQPPAISVDQMEPKVFAGSDIYLAFPVNSSKLKGAVQYPEFIKTIVWNKISGPASFTIDNPNAFETNLRNLEKGSYLFGLTVTSRAGLTGRDTISVSVLEEGSGKKIIVFKDRPWICPMGCHIAMENIFSVIPSSVAFKIYLKRDNSPDWVEILNMSQGFNKYNWTIDNNNLFILEDQTENPEDSPDVKIVY